MMLTIEPRVAVTGCWPSTLKCTSPATTTNTVGVSGWMRGVNLRARRRGVVGRVLFGIENDLLGPVVLALVQVFQIGQPPQRPHRGLVDSALSLIHPPIFGGATATAAGGRLGLAR